MKKEVKEASSAAFSENDSLKGSRAAGALDGAAKDAKSAKAGKGKALKGEKAEMTAEELKEAAPSGRAARGVKIKLDNPGAIFARLMKYIFARYFWRYLIVVVCIFISAIASVRGTLFIQSLIDDYITPMTKQASPDYGPLLKAILVMAAIYAVGVVASYLRERLLVNIGQGTLRDIRIDMFTHMETLPIRYFDQTSHGDIMSMYTNDVDTLRQMISQSIPSFIQSLVTIISTLVSMIILSVPMTLVNVAMVALTLFVTMKVAGASGRYFVRQQSSIGKLNGYIEEMMSGEKVIKVFNYEEEAVQRFNEYNDALCETSNNANRFANALGPINSQLGNLGYVVCAVFGGYLALSGRFSVTIGILASFLLLNKSFSRPVNEISSQLNSVVMALAGADRVFKLMDEEPEKDEGYVTLVNANISEDGTISESEERTGKWAWKHFHKADGTTTYKLQQGEVVMDGVDFGYEPEKQVLYDVRLYAKPGQKIAFVGSTGAGKTTITNLINRFYDIQDGKIRYDGININKIKKPELRRSLGMVLQDTHLFTATVMENIRYGRLDATDEEVYAAARLANADGFIRRLPEGYGTMLHGDGANLSQGQRQLLAIARAAIADPPVLILDEATSSIDTRTEKIVQEGMDKLMRGRTSFVIAHRLSTVRNADCICVLEKGRIIERGTHDDLIEKKGKYYQLYTGLAVNS